MAHTVQCKQCERSVTVSDHDIDVHVAVDATGCACCPQDHHHGQASAGPGAEPCRPLLITMLPGAAEVA